MHAPHRPDQAARAVRERVAVRRHRAPAQWRGVARRAWSSTADRRAGPAMFHVKHRRGTRGHTNESERQRDARTPSVPSTLRRALQHRRRDETRARRVRHETGRKRPNHVQSRRAAETVRSLLTHVATCQTSSPPASMPLACSAAEPCTSHVRQPRPRGRRRHGPAAPTQGRARPVATYGTAAKHGDRPHRVSPDGLARRHGAHASHRRRRHRARAPPASTPGACAAPSRRRRSRRAREHP